MGVFMAKQKKQTKEMKKFERRIRALRAEEQFEQYPVTWSSVSDRGVVVPARAASSHDHDDCPTCVAMRSGDHQAVLQRMFSSGNIVASGIWADKLRGAHTPDELDEMGITLED
jgi:hypothetical protein